MTLGRSLAVALAALFAAAADDDPRPIFRFKEYPHPIAEVWAGVTLSSDGKRIAAAANDTLVVWETETGKPTIKVRLPVQPAGVLVVFAVDGKTLVSDSGQDKATRFWDLKTGTQARELEHPADVRVLAGLRPAVLAFDSEARRLIAFGGKPDGLRVHDTVTGKVVAELEGTSNPRDVVFSPDGNLLAYSSEAGGLALLNAITGKKVRDLILDSPASSKWVGFATFSPDGKYVAGGEIGGPGGAGPLRYLTVWRVADGKRCARVFTDGGFTSAAFAKDGRTLAAAGGPHGLYLYDLATDTLHLWAKLPSPHGVSVAASSDGSTLAVIAPASKGGGRSVYVMPFPVHEDDSFGPSGPNDKELAESWDGIVGDNEFRRAHEITRLRPHADRLVTFARGKVQPVPDLFRQRAEDLIENLASPDIRDKVTENLHLVVHEFEPLLESARKKAPEGDVRNRLTAVLKKMKETPPPEKLSATVRAVEALEQLGTPEARKVLVELAAGAAGAKVTEEAAAALKRTPDKPR